LVKKVDEATVKNSGSRMGSFVVICSDDKDLEDKLKEVSEKAKLKKIVLTIDNPSGPSGYQIAKDADITVVLYNKRTVKVNHAFKKGEMKAKDIDAIVAEVSKILPDTK